MDILIQVNIGRDEKKSGVAPEEAEDLLKTDRSSFNTEDPWSDDNAALF